MGLSITDLAEVCGVSQSTVSRFCIILGYAGFKAFQFDLVAAMAQRGEPLLDDFVAGESVAATVRRVFEGNRRTLAETERILDRNALKRVAQCVERAGKTCLLGLGASGLIARYAAQRLMSLGLHAVAMVDPYDQVFATAGARRGDAVIGISHSGSTGGVVEGLDAARKHGARTVALTNCEHSALAKTCEFKLITAFRESKPSAVFSSSHVAQMSVIDSLYFVLAGRGIKSASRLTREVEQRAKSLLERRKKGRSRTGRD